MHKMLASYKKEEDENFKDKFKALFAAEETRARIKEELNNARSGISKENQSSNGEGPLSTRQGDNEEYKSVSLKRTRSHSNIKKPDTAH